LLLATVVGLITWIVLWSLGGKGFDAFMITALVIVAQAALLLHPMSRDYQRAWFK
jgi:hypothetical protein